LCVCTYYLAYAGKLDRRNRYSGLIFSILREYNYQLSSHIQVVTTLLQTGVRSARKKPKPLCAIKPRFIARTPMYMHIGCTLF